MTIPQTSTTHRHKFIVFLDHCVAAAQIYSKRSEKTNLGTHFVWASGKCCWIIKHLSERREMCFCSEADVFRVHLQAINSNFAGILVCAFMITCCCLIQQTGRHEFHAECVWFAACRSTDSATHIHMSAFSLSAFSPHIRPGDPGWGNPLMRNDMEMFLPVAQQPAGGIQRVAAG